MGDRWWRTQKDLKKVSAANIQLHNLWLFDFCCICLTCLYQLCSLNEHGVKVVKTHYHRYQIKMDSNALGITRLCKIKRLEKEMRSNQLTKARHKLPYSKHFVSLTSILFLFRVFWV